MKALLTIFIFLQTLFAVAFATPAQIVIIRHGEKPAYGNELNEQGLKRAMALPQFFNNNKIVNQFGTPAAIYAGAPENPHGSIRSIQTITPYANSLGMTVHKQIKKDDLDVLVHEVLNTPAYDGHTVVICWEHSVIPEMAHMLGATEAPESWDDGVFDRTWIIQYKEHEAHLFLNIAQHVLPADSAQ